MGEVYTIPAGYNFAPALIKKLLSQTQGNPSELANITIILPMNRTRRIIEDVALKLSPDNAVFLPKMITLGEIDDEDISIDAVLSSGSHEVIPDSIDPLERQMILTRLIMGFWAQEQQQFTQDQAFMLARSLSSLIDQIHTQGLDPHDLQDLVPDHLAAHWQKTLDFLKIITQHWPLILREKGVVDPAERRDRLIRALAAHWQSTQPTSRIIIAGSTGSIPAVADLMAVIATLPSGEIILPGLDQSISYEKWEQIPAYHPQYGLKKLLFKLEKSRNSVKIWGECDKKHKKSPLLSSIMGDNLEIIEKNTLNESLKGVSYYECDDEQQESDLIALKLRDMIARDSQETAIVVTPDRNLARRIIASAARWDITLDDSAGQPLHKTPEGTLILQIAQWWQSPQDSVRFLSMIKHPLSLSKFRQKGWDLELCEFEKSYIRAQNGQYSWHHKLIEIDKNNHPAHSEKFIQFLQDLYTNIEPIMSAVHADQNKEILFNFNDLYEIHNKVINQLLQIDDFTNIGTDLHQNQAFSVINNILKHSDLFGNISLYSYNQILQTLLSQQTDRTSYGMHPQIQILGAIEGRTSHADLIIMSGLNEGTWPDAYMPDPWMSENMRKQFGLPIAEQKLSLSAHDFCQYISHDKVMITRSITQNGTPTLPARWIGALKMLCDHQGVTINSLDDNALYGWLGGLNLGKKQTPIERPAPTPPENMRPSSLSVTQIETWFKDPYSIYARKILNLRALESPGEDKEAAIKGDIIHKALENFTKSQGNKGSQEATITLMELAKDAANDMSIPDHLWVKWAASLHMAFSKISTHLNLWKSIASPYRQEIWGEMTINTPKADFQLIGRADRIDQVIDPLLKGHDTLSCAIIDYKSSAGSLNASGIKSGALPQLPLEALILQEGGFENMPAASVVYMGYWPVAAGSKGGQDICVKENIPDIIDNIKNNLVHMIDKFSDPNTPYICCPNPQNTPRFNDYTHLSRIAEWSAQEGDNCAELEGL